MLASVITYPHEVLRTRLQVHHLTPSDERARMLSASSMNMPPQPDTKKTKLVYPSMRQTFQVILKTEGILGFYHGMGVNLIRTVPNSALTILTSV